MSKASKSVKERTLTDAQGREIPVKVLHTEIVEKDAAVKKAMDCAIKLQERILSDKQKMIQIIENYLNDAARRNGLEWKGNALLISFDEKYRIEMRFREKIQFGIELQLAKQKIDECLKAWSADSNVNLRAIISEAFLVDKKGEIAKYRILRLRRYNIKDQTWKEAMELIDQAIQVVATKQYINFYERDESGQFRQIILNFPAL